jgi:DNA-binding NtrC family response regulator
MARRIHTIGARARGPFVDLNCSGLTTELVESELFGHERGSFTGALATKQGLFDIADDGTLFLDEIGDIDMRVQPRILKVLEEKRFRRMGDVRERSVDVRLIAATHQDLLASVAERRFRADLYYRISTIRLVMPALRERREDIMAIVAQMLDRVGQSDVTLSRDAEQRLVEHMWPGNVRELKNVIESSMLLRRGAMLTADDLRFDTLSHRMLAVAPVSNGVSQRGPIHVASARYLGEDATDATRAEVERAHIRNALLAEKGRVEAAARRLGIPRSTLYWKLKRYGLKPNGEELPPLEVG